MSSLCYHSSKSKTRNKLSNWAMGLIKSTLCHFQLTSLLCGKQLVPAHGLHLRPPALNPNPEPSRVIPQSSTLKRVNSRTNNLNPKPQSLNSCTCAWSWISCPLNPQPCGKDVPVLNRAVKTPSPKKLYLCLLMDFTCGNASSPKPQPPNPTE